MTVVAVPERGPELAVGGISSFEGILTFFEGRKVEWVPVAGRGDGGAPDLVALLDDSVPSAYLLATGMSDGAVDGATGESSAAEVPGAAPTGL